jgi:hypothetical protein
MNYRSNRPSSDARLCSQCHGFALACEACDASGWEIPFTPVIEWVDEEAGEIIDERTLTAIEQGDYFPSNHPTYERLANGDIAITMDQGGWREPDKRVTAIFTRHTV